MFVTYRSQNADEQHQNDGKTETNATLRHRHCVVFFDFLSLSHFPNTTEKKKKGRKKKQQRRKERERRMCVCVFCRVSLVRAPIKRPSYRLSILQNKKIRKIYNSFNAVSNGSGYPLCFDLTVVRFLTLN